MVSKEITLCGFKIGDIVKPLDRLKRNKCTALQGNAPPGLFSLDTFDKRPDQYPRIISSIDWGMCHITNRDGLCYPLALSEIKDLRDLIKEEGMETELIEDFILSFSDEWQPLAREILQEFLG